MIILVMGWYGAALLCVAPFILSKFPQVFTYMMIAGLAFLIPQLFEAELWNVILLNTVGIVGYCWSLRK